MGTIKPLVSYNRIRQNVAFVTQTLMRRSNVCSILIAAKPPMKGVFSMVDFFKSSYGAKKRSSLIKAESLGINPN